MVIFIGLMKWFEEEFNLKFKRGKRLVLKVFRDVLYKILIKKVVEKWKSYDSNFYEEGEDYVFLLVLFLFGLGKEFFSLRVIKRKLEKILSE